MNTPMEPEASVKPSKVAKKKVRRKPRQNKTSSPPPPRTTTVHSVLTDLERLQHRAVVLEKLADEAVRLFLNEAGRTAQYLIGAPGGLAVPARLEVVELVQIELRRAAQRARQQGRRLLGGTLPAPVDEPVPPITADIPVPQPLAADEEALAQLLAGLIANPVAAATGRPR
jgi:hypothetical protein